MRISSGVSHYPPATAEPDHQADHELTTLTPSRSTASPGGIETSQPVEELAPRDRATSPERTPAGQRGTLAPTLQERLESTRKTTIGLKRKANDVSKQLAEFHCMLSEMLGEARIKGEITGREEQAAIEGIEKLLRRTPALEQSLQKIIEHTQSLEKSGAKEDWGTYSKRKASEWKTRTTELISPRAAGAVCLGLAAMAAKNGAWYMPSLISSKNIPFESVSEMAKVFFERWATANTAAGAAEYPASVISQRMFKATGNSMNEFLATLQLGDMVSAYAALKVTGQKISAFEGLGLASVAVAALIRTGTLGKVWNRFNGAHEQQQIGHIAFDQPQLEYGSSGAPTPAPSTDRDLERQQPRPAEARNDSKRIQQLFEKIPDATWAARISNFKGLMADLDELQRSESQHSTPASSSTNAQGAEPLPSADDIGGLTEMLGRVQQELTSPAFESYREALAQIKGSQNGETDETQLDQLRVHLKAFKKDLDETGGKDPKTIGFAIGMLAAYAVPVILGNVGQLTNNPVLASPVTRGALNIMGSVSAQTAANLGHHLLEEKEDDSALWKHIKSTGVAIGLTPTEFLPLVLGLLYMDKASDKAQVRDGASSPWPRTGTLRVFQELGRAFYSTLFTQLTIGTPVTKSDIAGLLVQLGGAGLATGLDYRQHSQAAKPDRA